MATVFDSAGLAERYRPTALADVLGQERIVRVLERLPSFGGRAFWIAGPSGAGKTTLAKIIADGVADDFATVELTGRELTAGELNGLLAQAYRGRPLGGRGWAIIVNEAHGLSRHAIERLLDCLDSGAIPPWVVWIFTTTLAGQDKIFDDMIDAHPLLSRCLELPLALRGLAEPFARHALDIAIAEGLGNEADYSKVLRLVKEKRNNLRAVLSAIEAGALLGDE